MKIATATELTASVSPAITTTENGITMRGKWILRTRFSRARTACTAAPVASPKNW